MAEIISEFIHENEKNYNKLRNNLSQFKKIFQFIYSNVYPEIYCSTEVRGFGLIYTFHLIFKTSKDMKKLEKTGKNPQDGTLKRNDTFNDQEEKEIKEKVVKRKRKRQEVTEKSKALKRQKKAKKDKEDN